MTGLAEKDATVIRFFRGLFREHKVSSDLWPRWWSTSAVKRTIDMMALMRQLLHGGHDDERRRSASAAGAPAADAGH